MRNVIFYTQSTGRVRPQRSLILYFEDRASSHFPSMMVPPRMWLFKVAPRRVLEGLLGWDLTINYIITSRVKRTSP